MTEISSIDLAELREAKHLLENPGITAKLTNLLGTPIEKGFNLLPSNWREKIGTATRNALMVALNGALLTMNTQQQEAYPRWHKFAAAVSGGVGGAFGLPALALELPVSTTIMLRSIADIARSHGEDLSVNTTHIACLEVFALGGTSQYDNASESGYFAAREALAHAIAEASKYLAENVAIEKSAPPLLRFITRIALQFEIQVSEKAAAMAIPAIGAIGGGMINYLFIDHFQDMSQGHFTIRKLERKYNPELIRKVYDTLKV